MGGPAANAFRVSFADMAKSDGGRLDPFFHDWLAQYREIQSMLDARRFSAIADVLEMGQTKNSREHSRRFAPEVRERLLQIFGDPQLLRSWSVAVSASRAGIVSADVPAGDVSGAAIDRNEPRQLARRSRSFGP